MDIRTSAKKIQKYLDPSFKLWPFNRFNPEDSDWWFAATSDNPAFNEAKIFVSQVPPQIESPERSIFTGLYLEKGISGAASEFYPTKFVMDKTWDWNRLSDSKYIDRITSAVQNITLCGKVYLTLDIFLLPIDKIDESSNSDLIKNEFQATKLIFSIDTGAELRIEYSFINNLDQESPKIVATFQKVNSLPDLFDKILISNDINHWRWIDLRIGAIMDELTDSQDIERLIKPWQKILLT